MRHEDLRTFAEIGKALWHDPSLYEPTTAETITAISLLPLTDEGRIERAARALLDRASQQGMASNVLVNLTSIHDSFFRLFPEERLLMVALHHGRWSYARVARILQEPVEAIEERAWAVRSQLALGKAKVPYPVGSAPAGPSCPAYDLKRPWPQRFLDDEIPSGTDKMFLQSHLLQCDPCRKNLIRCRELYFAVEKLIPRLEASTGAMDRPAGAFVERLAMLSRETLMLIAPAERTFVESLEVFARRADIRVALAALGAIVLALIARHR